MLQGWFHAFSPSRQVLPPPCGPGPKLGVTLDVCACPPSVRFALVHPPDTTLLTGPVSGPSSGGLSPGKCSAKYTEVAFSFCSEGRGRLRFKQHHVSWGSALSEGKGPWALRLPGVSEWVHKASSGQPGAVRAERKELGRREQQGLSTGRGGPE